MVHLYCTDTNTVSKHTETRFHMMHSPRVPSGVSNMISESMVRWTQTAHLSCVKIITISKQTRHLGVSSGASKMISEPIIRLAQTVHLYCTDTNAVSKRTKTRFHLTHSPRSSIGCAQHDFLAGGTLGTNHAPFSRQHYHCLQTESN
jgi:hypothetical protein